MYEADGAQHAAPLQRRGKESSEVADDFAGGIGAASAGQAVAGMRAGAARKKAADGRFVARPIENGTHGEKLIECELAMKNVAAGEAVGSFEIKRRDDLHVFDEIGQIRRVSGQGFDNGVSQVEAARVPVPFFQPVRSELNVGGEHVLAIGSERGIENRGDGDVEPGSLREITVLGGVEGALKVVDFRADVDAAG